MNKPKIGSMKLNFETVPIDDIEALEAFDLFHCHKCGFHAKVISLIWIEGYEEDFAAYLKHIKPGKTEFVEKINNVMIPKEGKLVEEILCGNCGRSGQIVPLPKTLLQIHGIIIYNEDKNKEKINITKEA